VERSGVGIGLFRFIRPFGIVQIKGDYLALNFVAHFYASSKFWRWRPDWLRNASFLTSNQGE
jgi:hypothetical protein